MNLINAGLYGYPGGEFRYILKRKLASKTTHKLLLVTSFEPEHKLNKLLLEQSQGVFQRF